jgi:O-antigen/teichoic acid export membrane protein
LNGPNRQLTVAGFSKDVIAYAVANAANGLLTVALTPFYTHSLGFGDLAAITVIASITSLVAALSSLGLENAAHRWFWERADRTYRLGVFNSWLTVHVTVAIAVGGLLALGGPALLELLDVHHHGGALRIAALSFPLRAGFLVVYGWHRAARQPWRVMLLTGVQALTQIGLTIWLVKAMEPVAGVMVAQTASFGLGVIACVVLLPDLFRPRRIDRPLLRAMLRFSLPFVPAAAFSWALALADRAILSATSTPQAVATYQVAVAFSLGIGLPVIAFQQAFGPFALSMHREPGARDQFRKLFFLSSVGLAWAVVIGGVIAFDFVPMVFGAAYRPGVLAGVVLGVSQVPMAVFAAASLPFIVDRRTRIVAVAFAVAGTLDVVLCWILAPRYGALGAAWAMLASQVVMPLVLLIPSQRRFFIGLRPALCVSLLGVGGIAAVAVAEKAIGIRLGLGVAASVAAAVTVWRELQLGQRLRWT